MELYNAVFQFLLQVKMAKWCLDEIRISRELCPRVDITLGHYVCACVCVFVGVHGKYFEHTHALYRKQNTRLIYILEGCEAKKLAVKKHSVDGLVC